MLLALTIIMSASLASRMLTSLYRKRDFVSWFGIIVVEGMLFQPILWILYSHT
jgi:hypothetical protein